MEVLAFGHAGAKVLIFPTRDGRFHEYEDLRLVESLRHKLEAGQLQLWCVDSIDWESLYCCWCRPADRIRRHHAFEGHVLNEVMPLMASKNPHPCTISHGCSLGAFHAATNIAFRHPHLFQKLVALSGRYDLTLDVEDFRDLLDGHRDEQVYFHTPTQYLPNLPCPQRLDALRRMDSLWPSATRTPFSTTTAT
jgi:esterase/lipase superfamily enzyme